MVDHPRLSKTALLLRNGQGLHGVIFPTLRGLCVDDALERFERCVGLPFCDADLLGTGDTNILLHYVFLLFDLVLIFLV